MMAAQWRKKRLDRMLVDHFLRSGYYNTAIKLARHSGIEVFLQRISSCDLFVFIFVIIIIISSGAASRDYVVVPQK